MLPLKEQKNGVHSTRSEGAKRRHRPTLENTERRDTEQRSTVRIAEVKRSGDETETRSAGAGLLVLHTKIAVCLFVCLCVCLCAHVGDEWQVEFEF